jgi:phosphopantothenoylcysteine decarboxylase/phosphopantothenate--cysteine ligase
MGAALAQAVLNQGDLPVIVSGSVEITYPDSAEIHWTETTEEMLQCCVELFPQCSGVIGAAAPCDFMPVMFSPQKLQKPADGSGITVAFRETPDILATLGQMKRQDQWSIGFALETAGVQNGGKEHALEKLQKKNCRLIVLNTPDSISKSRSTFQVFDAAGTLRLNFTGTKAALAEKLLSMSGK